MEALDEDKDHDRRKGSDGDGETTLLERERSRRLDEQSSGSNLELVETLFRVLRRERDGERVVKAAALCISRSEKSKREGNA